MRIVSFMTIGLMAIALTTAAQEPNKRLGNPVVALAKSTEESIAAQEKELSDELAEMVAVIDAAVAQVDGKDWQSEKTAIESFRPLVGKLRLAAKELLAREAAYAASVDELAEVLQNAPKTYQQAAEVYRGYAAEEAFPDIKSDYLRLAESWDRVAQSMKARQEELVPEKAEVKQFLSYVRSTAKFLDRFDQHLAAYPRAESLAARDEYLKKLKVYVEYFGKLRELLQKLNGRLVTPAAPSPPITQKATTTISVGITNVARTTPPKLSSPAATEELTLGGNSDRTLLDAFEREIADHRSRNASSREVVVTRPTFSPGEIRMATETWGIVDDDGGLSLRQGQVREVLRDGRWIGEVEVRNSNGNTFALRPIAGVRMRNGDQIAARR